MDHSAPTPDPAVLAEFLEACAAAQASGRELDLTAFIARFPEHEQSLRQAYAARMASDDGESMAGKSVGPYRIVRELGQGGMGRVYLAEQSEPFERQVALKVIKLGMDTDEILKRFDRERQALALMDHDAIARVYDAGSTESGQPYVALEYVQGEPLTQFCDRHRLSLRDRILLMCRVCDGVQHAHQKGIVHRDLTPGNILVTETTHGPSPKIIDFGIARIVRKERAEVTGTMHGVVLGTPSYMSPEQAGYRDLDVDSRSDVYSLGVLLFEMLTGMLPYPGLAAIDLDKIAHRAHSGRTARPSASVADRGEAADNVAAARRSETRHLVRALRGDLDAIVTMALATDREERYATAEALAADLRRFLELRPIAAKRTTFFDSMRKAMRRHRQLLSTACLAVAGIAAWVTAYLSTSELRLSREAATAMVWPFLSEGPSDAWIMDSVNELSTESERAGAHYILTLLARRDKQLRRIAQHLPHALRVVDEQHEQDPAVANRRTKLAIAALYAGSWQVGLELAAKVPTKIAPDDEFGGSRWYALILGGKYDEARRLCPPDQLTKCLLDAGSWALQTTGVTDARRIFEYIRDDAMQRKDYATATTAQLRLGGVAWFEGNYPLAIQQMREASRTVTNSLAEASVRNSLGAALRDAGKFLEADQELEIALGITRQKGDSRQIQILNNLGRSALGQGDVARAENHFRSSLRANNKFFPPNLENVNPLGGAYAESMLGLGVIASLRGEFDRALLLIQTARVTWQRTSGPGSHYVGEAESTLGDVLSRRRRANLDYAERLMLEGYAKITSLRTRKARISRMAQARLVAFAERNGMTEKAATWRRLHLE